MFETATIVEAAGARSQDRGEVIELSWGLVIVVADGVGGISGGAEAAETAVRIVREAAASLSGAPEPAGWAGLLARMDRQISADPVAGETTAVVAAVTSDGLAGASVGDSGAWVISAGACLDLTRGQHGKPFLGSGAARPVHFAAGRLDGTLLVASDGLLKYAGRDQIIQAARQDDLQQAAESLVGLVRLGSGGLPDDTAVILCR